MEGIAETEVGRSEAVGIGVKKVGLGEAVGVSVVGI